MLNAVLTGKTKTLELSEWIKSKETPLYIILFYSVRQHQANSHAKKGWEQFTDSVIETISRKKKGIVFLLWGNYAQAKSRYSWEQFFYLKN